ncbi:hypothetical protein NEDG_01665 [Nematocida displodere]|uniref:Uncharacterized protein n=1 Tax=Nematocida displodere TaxID=1805483 RepID=A0A177EJE3_9MICR|nr:hypothetical protein NEDG_01665 [Nematocida displodere]
MQIDKILTHEYNEAIAKTQGNIYIYVLSILFFLVCGSLIMIGEKKTTTVIAQRHSSFFLSTILYTAAVITKFTSHGAMFLLGGICAELFAIISSKKTQKPLFVISGSFMYTLYLCLVFGFTMPWSFCIAPTVAFCALVAHPLSRHVYPTVRYVAGVVLIAIALTGISEYFYNKEHSLEYIGELKLVSLVLSALGSSLHYYRARQKMV